MVKVKVVRAFNDKETGVYYNVGEIVDFTVSRAKDIKENSKKLGFDYIEEVEKVTSTKVKGRVNGATKE